MGADQGLGPHAGLWSWWCSAGRDGFATECYVVRLPATRSASVVCVEIARNGRVCGMSLAELKKEAASLTEAEKRELAAFLREQTEPQFAARAARVNALMREMDAGRKYSRADFERADRDLTSAGL